MNTDLVRVDCPSGLVVWMQRLTPAEILMAGISLWNPIAKKINGLPEKPAHLSPEKWEKQLPRIRESMGLPTEEEAAEYTVKVKVALERFAKFAELPDGRRLHLVVDFRMPQDEEIFLPIDQLHAVDFATLHDYLIGKYGRDEARLVKWLRSDTAKNYAHLGRFWNRLPCELIEGFPDDPVLRLIINSALTSRLAEE